MRDQNLWLYILEQGSFGGAVDLLKGRNVQGREIAGARVANRNEAGAWQAVFVSTAEAPRMDAQIAPFFQAGRC